MQIMHVMHHSNVNEGAYRAFVAKPENHPGREEAPGVVQRVSRCWERRLPIGRAEMVTNVCRPENLELWPMSAPRSKLAAQRRIDAWPQMAHHCSLSCLLAANERTTELHAGRMSQLGFGHEGSFHDQIRGGCGSHLCVGGSGRRSSTV